MKKTILSLLSLLMAGSTMTAQNQMHISLKDGTVQTFDVTDVDSIYWSEKVADQHEYVDLGLSVKWATCNVGATALRSMVITSPGVRLLPRQPTIGAPISIAMAVTTPRPSIAPRTIMEQ